MPDRRTPFWLWPNLLSLDAPIVALVWLAIFARTWRVNYLEWQAYLALGLAVWSIYVLDRLLDVKLLHPDDPRLGGRHEFVKRHQGKLGWLLGAALLTCAGLLFFVLPSRLIISPNEMSYLVPVAGATIIFFSLNLASAGSTEIPHLRNLLAGLTFSFGTAMQAHLQLGAEPVVALITSREMLCFALLCAANISSIHFWEESRQSPDRNFRAAHELALTLPLVVLGGACVAFASADHETARRPFYYAVLIAAALLFVINRRRDRFSLDALRVLADVALIAPFPVFLALSSGN